MITADDVRWARGIGALVARKHPAARALADDLASAAVEGLVRAAGAYREGTGATFRTFAQHRVLGSALDFLRREKLKGTRRPAQGRSGGEKPCDGAGQRAFCEVPERAVDGHQEAWAELVAVAGRLERLTPTYRFILVQLAVGTTLEEVGEAIGAGKSWTCRLARRARAELAAQP